MSRPSPPRSLPLPVVLDTNVVLDVLVFDDPITRPLAAALAEGALVAWADEQTLLELERVLPLPSFKLDVPARREVLERYRRMVRLASTESSTPLPELPRCRDRDDQMFLVLTARAGAAWLVSKDKRVLSLADRHGLPFEILTPKQAAQGLELARRLV
ncbi:putative toxin-antitoxin system toxin component, PIN family [Hyalangium versicolor]|uniref:putative toxin-antitoxin system toxin component, PIN family n=1 Tax=Hyalangium versicolor TaxID=2861190 RepID=UPI001CCDA1BC|nr:putative toxin-antitoxin system toxin component, PIN family [Hyalangium versicolor]